MTVTATPAVIGTHGAQELLTSSLYEDFIQDMDCSPKSVETYSRAIRSFLSYLLQRGIDAPQRKDVLAYRESITGSLSSSTVRSYMTAVRKLFAWASATGRYPDIAEGIKSGVKKDRTFRKDYLQADEVRDILGGIDTSSLKGLRDYAIVSLMVTCGLRDVEVVRADISDLERRGARAKLYVQGKGRTDKDDYVLVPFQVAGAIAEYLGARGSSEGPLFASVSNRDAGARMTTRSVSRLVKEAMLAAGYESDRLTAHSLRHTAVTLAVKAGCSVEEAQVMARHADISTTMLYCHAIEKESNICSSKVAGQIFTASSAGFSC